MPRPDSSASVHLSADPASAALAEDRPESDTPFRILVLGDFSGRRNRRLPPPAGPLRTREITPETLDDLPGVLGAELGLSPEGLGAFRLRFRDLDDFHPERVLRQVPPAPPSQAAPAPEPPPAAAVPEPPPARPELPASGNLLDAILGGDPLPPPPPPKPDALRAAINRIVEPHLVKEPSAAERQRAAHEAQTEAGRLRLAMAHPDFRELESNWRTLFWMLSKLPVGVELQVHILDLAKAEAAADLAAGGPLLSRLLIDETVGTPGAAPWAVLAALWPLEATEADLDLIYGMGQIASAARAPFLASMEPLLAGCADVRHSVDPREWTDSLPDGVKTAWAALRSSAAAPWTGLTTPRWLVRLPYGEGGLSSDVEAFEEAASGFEAGNFLWASGAAFCAVLLGAAFERGGWDFTPESSLGLDGMPVYVRGTGVQAEAMSSTEAWLGERAAEHILDHGLIPLVTVKNRDVVRIVRWQSIASPPARLRGRWE